MSDDANKLAIEAICMHICTGSYKQLSHTAEFNYWMVPDSNNRLIGCGDRLLRYSDYSAAPTTPVPLRLRVPVRLHQAVQAVRLLFRLSGYFKIVRLHRRLHQLRVLDDGFWVLDDSFPGTRRYVLDARRANQLADLLHQHRLLRRADHNSAMNQAK